MISYSPFNYYRPRLSIWIWLHLSRHDRLITRFLSVVTQFRQFEILLWNFYEANVLSLWIWRWTKLVSPLTQKIPESLKRVILIEHSTCVSYLEGRTSWVACSFRETRVPKQRGSSSHPKRSKEMRAIKSIEAKSCILFLRLLPEAKLIPPKSGMEAQILVHRWS